MLSSERGVWLRRAIPYGLAGLGLVVGLLVLLARPFPGAARNYLLGGAFLGLAVASVASQIVAASGPDERRPDF